jgi:sodium transport system permease protein
VLAIYYREDRPVSRTSSEKTFELFINARRARRAEALLARGFPVPPDDIAPIDVTDVATPAERAGSRSGHFLTAIILLFMLVGGASVASDAIAGEKERGTLETLLCTAMGRNEIIAAKLLLVLTATLATTTVQLVNLVLSITLGLGAPELAAALTPASALLLFALFLPVSLLVASALLLTSGLANSYKEAQLYFTPLVFLGPTLALASTLPGLSLRSIAVLVPIVNISLAVKEVLLQKIDAPMLALAFLVTSAAAVLLARRTAALLVSERLIVPAQADEDAIRGGVALFRARVLRFYAVLWAVSLLASLSFALKSLEAAVLAQQALFMAAVLFLIRRYRLPLREALSLRLPKPIVWLAVVMGAPASAIVALGLFRLASLVLPVPQSMLEEMSRTLIPEEISLPKLLLLVAVVPAICEELTFRGLLLYGLRRRLRPAWICVVVGVIFGVFHIALFRLVTTSFLGILLSAVLLFTGSILPCILWHAINNALPVLASRSSSFPAAYLSDPPLIAYPIAAAVLAACLSVLWKHRRVTEI